MTHPTTLAIAELKRVLAAADKADAMRKLGGDPTIPATSAAFGADIEGGPAVVVLGNGKRVDGVLYRRVKRDVMAQFKPCRVTASCRSRRYAHLNFGHLWTTLTNSKRADASCTWSATKK